MSRIGLSLWRFPRACQYHGLGVASVLRCARWQSTATARSTFEQLTRREVAVTRLLSTLKLPRSESMQVGGATIDLPLRSSRANAVPEATPTAEEVQYLAGFFDSDGCIYKEGKEQVPRIDIVQTIDNPAVLLLFRRLFGGGIYHHAAGRGIRKSSIRWILKGKVVPRVAAMLREASLTQRPQPDFLSTSQEPEQAQEGSATEAELPNAERQPAPTALTCSSWEYFAGFFDAGGCVHVRARGAEGPLVHISLSRETPEILMALQRMLRQEFPEFVLYEPGESSKFYRLACQENIASRAVLKRLIDAGLLTKRKVATLAVESMPSNAHATREAISNFNGGQSRYRRHSEQGTFRALEIVAMTRKVGRMKRAELKARTKMGRKAECHQAEEGEWLWPETVEGVRELEELQQNHKMLCTADRLERMRRDVRGLLRRGATRGEALMPFVAAS